MHMRIYSDVRKFKQTHEHQQTFVIEKRFQLKWSSY
jgi:hypothetical protein